MLVVFLIKPVADLTTFALKSQHVRFLQDFIVWPKCLVTGTTKTEKSQDRNDQTKNPVPNKSRLRLINPFAFISAVYSSGQRFVTTQRVVFKRIFVSLSHFAQYSRLDLAGSWVRGLVTAVEVCVESTLHNEAVEKMRSKLRSSSCLVIKWLVLLVQPPPLLNPTLAGTNVVYQTASTVQHETDASHVQVRSFFSDY